jgi:uncharacterized membrane protein YgcG
MQLSRRVITVVLLLLTLAALIVWAVVGLTSTTRIILLATISGLVFMSSVHLMIQIIRVNSVLRTLSNHDNTPAYRSQERLDTQLRYARYQIGLRLVLILISAVAIVDLALQPKIAGAEWMRWVVVVLSAILSAAVIVLQSIMLVTERRLRQNRDQEPQHQLPREVHGLVEDDEDDEDDEDKEVRVGKEVQEDEPYRYGLSRRGSGSSEGFSEWSDSSDEKSQ